MKKGSRKKREQMLAIDLGARSTKAVLLQRRGNGFALASYAVVDTPIFDKVISEDLLTEHLKAITQTMQAKGKPVTMTVSVEDAIVRQVEMPVMPPDAIRMILKNNPRVYLQQDLAGYVFDSFSGNGNGNAAPAPKDGQQKAKVLIAGTKSQIVTTYVAAAKGAGLIPDHIVPGILGPVNAFELAMPEAFAGRNCRAGGHWFQIIVDFNFARRRTRAQPRGQHRRRSPYGRSRGTDEHWLCRS